MGTFLMKKTSSQKVLFNIAISLIPAIGIYLYQNFNNDSGNIIYSILVLVLSGSITFLTDFIYRKIRKIKVTNDNSYLSGVILALLIPINVPIYVILSGALLTGIIKIIVQLIFKKQVINNILLSYIILLTIFGNDLISNGLNHILILLSLLYLLITKSIKYRITLSYISVFVVSLCLIATINSQPIDYISYELLNGWLLFGMIFLAPDFKTSPVTPIGQIIYGSILGLITCIFRVFSFDGVFIAILIGNCLTFLFDKIGKTVRFNKNKTILIMVILIMFILGISMLNAIIFETEIIGKIKELTI